MASGAKRWAVRGLVSLILLCAILLLVLAAFPWGWMKGPIERRLSDMGDVNVHVVDDPVRLGAMGGLRLSMEVPEDMWKNLTLASR